MRREFARLDRRDRAHVHHDLARGQALGHALFAEQHAGDVGGVRQHQEDDVGLPRHIGRTGARLDARIQQRLRHAAARMSMDGVAAGLQMQRHGLAHYAESDKSDLAHVDIRLKGFTR
jgi:hypothetical protein